MSDTYDFTCDKCGCKTYLESENDYEKIIICENCAECYIVEYKKSRPQPNIPKCPICNSPNIQKISGTERVASIATLGIFSRKFNKSFKCKNCGATF